VKTIAILYSTMSGHNIINDNSEKKFSFVDPLISTYPAKSLKTLFISPTFIEKIFFFSRKMCNGKKTT